MIWRVLSYVFFLMGVTLLGVAACAYYFEAGAGGALIEDAEREFPDLIVGENTVTYRLHNPTRHTVRVVGCSFC